MTDPKAIQFFALMTFLVLSVLLGVIGFLMTPQLIAGRMANLRARKLERFAPYVALVLRVLFVLLAVLSAYLLTKTPFIYQCAFG